MLSITVYSGARPVSVLLTSDAYVCVLSIFFLFCMCVSKWSYFPIFSAQCRCNCWVS